MSLINLGKELKILVPRRAQAFCPVASLHLGNVRHVSSLFAWYLFGEVHSGINFFYVATAIATIVYSPKVTANVDQFQQI